MSSTDPVAPTLPTTRASASRRIEGRRLATFLRQRKLSLAGLTVFALIVLVAIAAPLVAPHDPLKQNLGDNFQPPVWSEGGTTTYLLGTDPLGRDLLSRLIYGARSSLLISVSAVLLGGGLGFVIGLIAGFFGRWTDTVLMRLGDIQLAFPFVLFAIAILAVSPERTVWHLIVVLGLSSWVIYARIVRSKVLIEREKDYAAAARALGASRRRVLFRYVLPNVWQVVPVIALLDLGFLVIVESLLSFIALGLSPPTPSWGSILADGRQFMMVSPWMALLPGFAILATVLSIGLAADGLSDFLDPKRGQAGFLRRSRAPRDVIDSARLDDAGSPAATGTPLLRVRDLTTVFPGETSTVVAVKGASFDLEAGKVLGIVGESGSGKSTLGLSIIGLLDSPGRVAGGEMLFRGQNLAHASDKEMAAIRGAHIGMIFQDPGASLNPVLTVGYQLEETLRLHQRLALTRAREAARTGLAAVGIADPDRVLQNHAFQLSGGMQQRVMIALAMACQPDLLILDEPTSALDVTTQAQLLDELESLRVASGTSMLFITHDIALLANFADDILVMYAGEVCEIGPRQRIIEQPHHPYTRALLDAIAGQQEPGTPRLSVIPGDPPTPDLAVAGCPFAARCPSAMPVCQAIHPDHTRVSPGHVAACHLLDSDAEHEPAAPTARSA